MMANGMKMVHDTKGYRRVVPSPMPLDIVEETVIKKLLSRAY